MSIIKRTDYVWKETFQADFAQELQLEIKVKKTHAQKKL